VTAARQEWIAEIAATVLLALAAVATAWSGYQASQWHGEQAVASSRATATRVEAARASDDANRQVEVDVATFTQWIDAYAQGESELAAFYRKRFRDEFQPAFKRWIASRPLTNPEAALTPFALPEYRLQAVADADRLEREAAAAGEEVKTDVERANRYVLAVVLFATALALAGIGARLRLFPIRTAVLALGWAVFLGALGWLATFPVSV
jgi:Domain of unknown function (DUF4337)